MKERVESWLKEEGKFVGYEDHPGCNWVINAKPLENQPMNLNIINPESSPAQLLIVGGQKISEEVQKFIDKMPKKKKKGLLLNIRLEMNRRPVEFKMNHPNGILSDIQVHYVIYKDGLTQHEFFKGLREVYKSILHFRWALQGIIGKPTKQGKQPFGSKVIPFQDDLF